MNRFSQNINSEQGNMMLVALMVLLIMGIMGMTIIDIAGMERKIAINDVKNEQARQAADAGIQVARTIIMNFLMEGEDIPPFPEVRLGDYISAYVSINTDKLNSSGIIKISSQGRVKSKNGPLVISETAQAEVRVCPLPNYPIQASSLTVMGRYFATVSDQPTFLEGSFPDDLKNIQDWYVTGWETSGGLPLAQRGLEYSDPGFQKTAHINYIPGNSENNAGNSTWWVNYQQSESGPELSGSTLNIAPFWKPQGIVNVINRNNQPAIIAANSWGQDILLKDNNVLFARPIPQPRADNYPIDRFTTGLTGDVNYIYPPEVFNNKDFMGKYIANNQIVPPNVHAMHLERFRKLAKYDPDWQVITPDSPLLNNIGENKYELSIDDRELNKSKLFIDMPDTATVVLNFTVRNSFQGQEWVGWDAFDNYVNVSLNDPGSFLIVSATVWITWLQSHRQPWRSVMIACFFKVLTIFPG